MVDAYCGRRKGNYSYVFLVIVAVVMLLLPSSREPSTWPIGGLRVRISTRLYCLEVDVIPVLWPTSRFESIQLSCEVQVLLCPSGIVVVCF